MEVGIAAQQGGYDALFMDGISGVSGPIGRGAQTGDLRPESRAVTEDDQVRKTSQAAFQLGQAGLVE
ncbi:MAG: hypothetical protein R6U36_10835, partial [Candidatus Fermentibacteraceae bacterium]